MISENAYGETNSSLEYWQNNRKSLSELYDSERYFLEPILKKINSVLDIGCAAGGAYQICTEVNPEICYSGIDISPELIELAKKNYPGVYFDYYDGHRISFSSGSFDLVFSIGVLHHLQHWKRMITQMVELSSNYVVFDIRLTKDMTLNDPQKYFQKIAFGVEWDGISCIPYLVLNVDEVKEFFKQFVEDGYHVELYGYSGKPTTLVSIPYDEVYMCSICIQKESVKAQLVDNIRW
ncbi:MAG: class I SAM-dependent methyltransferase [Bacteroidales bacterium]|nr:class I SAM-dependent methyltransferase [Bacteroidales bacterium]